MKEFHCVLSLHKLVQQYNSFGSQYVIHQLKLSDCERHAVCAFRSMHITICATVTRLFSIISPPRKEHEYCSCPAPEHTIHITVHRSPLDRTPEYHSDLCCTSSSL